MKRRQRDVEVVRRMVLLCQGKLQPSDVVYDQHPAPPRAPGPHVESLNRDHTSALLPSTFPLPPMSPPTPSDHRKPCTVCQTPRNVLVRCQIDSSQTWHFLCPGSCWVQASGGKIDGDGAEAHKYYRYGGMWKNKHEAVSAKKPKKKKKKKGGLEKQQQEERNDGEGDAGRSAESGAEATLTGESTAESESDAEGGAGPDAPGLEDQDTSQDEHEREKKSKAVNGYAQWQSTNVPYTRNDRVIWDNQTWSRRKSHTSDEHWTPGRAYSLWKTCEG